METEQTSTGQADKTGPTTLELVSLIASFGSLAFLAAPMFLAAFALLIALAGAICGWAARARPGSTWAATVGALVGTVTALLYLLTIVA